jgi:hypothetical protein
VVAESDLVSEDDVLLLPQLNNISIKLKTGISRKSEVLSPKPDFRLLTSDFQLKLKIRIIIKVNEKH